MALSQYKPFWLLAVLMVFLTGCDSAKDEKTTETAEGAKPVETATSAKMAKFSGYLDNYDQLTYLKDQNAFVFENQKNKGKYNKIYVGEVSLHNQAGVMNEELAKQATDYIHESIERILRNREVLSTEQSGEGVAVLKMAITGTEKTKEELSVADAIPEPFVFTVNEDDINPGAKFAEAAMEVELVDAKTNERLHAIVKIAVAETEKHSSNDVLTFDDIIPVIDSWLIQFEETVDAFKAARGGGEVVH